MLRFCAVCVVAFTTTLLSSTSWAADTSPAGQAAKEILDLAGVKGGLVVHLGCGGGQLTAALRAGDGFLVQGLDTDPRAVNAARGQILSKGLYGPVSVSTFDGERLPYADDLVQLVVVDKPGDVAMDEVLRVLCPGGVACVEEDGAWKKTVKPQPRDIDDWSHYLHDASGNAVAADRRVGPPRKTRWISDPKWERSHEFNPSINAAVSAGGRMFYTLDEGLAGMPDSPLFRLPARWSLIARDAFSGVLLWKRSIPNWGFREWNTVGMWSAPLTLQRRLVTDGEHVYFTFGYKNAPVTVLDAATGQTVRVLEGTEGTDELVLADGVLLLCVREQLSVASPPGPREKAKQRRRMNPHEWSVCPPGPASIVAVDPKTGKKLWSRDPEPVKIITLSAAGNRACYHNSEAVVCVDIANGKEVWTAKCRPSGGSRHSAGTLVIHDGVVLYTSGEGVLALSLESGERLWTGPRVSGPGITHPADLFVADGLVWIGDQPGEHKKDRVAVKREGRDLKTGEVKRTIQVKHLISPMHHFRCYRSKATDRYLLLTKRGVEFLDLEEDDHMRNDWLRAGCHYGFIPCNGLLYITPHHCFCYPGVKLNGFLALAAAEEKGNRSKADPAPRLVRGPAFGKLPDMATSQGDWPTYRHDGARSGSTTQPVSTNLSRQWEVDLGGRLSQAVVAGDTVFVSQVDAHTVHALTASDGRKLWSFTAGARVDTPPTVHEGTVLFGSRDGWVYCLRAEDGALAWRFRAAPEERRIVAFEQVESPWPVPGSVLVQRGTAYVAAGRSSFLDGGVYLYGLDPKTGEVRCQNQVVGPWPDPEDQTGRPFDMEGTKGDLLVGDGKQIYLFQMTFDNELRQVETPRASTLGDRETGLHLMSTGGFVDYEWYDRTYWTYSRRWPGFYYANSAPKAGQILVFDAEKTYGLHVFTRRDRLSPATTPGRDGYELFADSSDNEPVLAPNSINREKGPGFSRAADPLWSRHIRLRVRGLTLAGDTLFLAGDPDVVPEDDPYAAYDGRLGAKLWAVSAADGEKLFEMPLAKAPVFDGLIAAGGRLLISTTDGKLLCLSGKEQASR